MKDKIYLFIREIYHRFFAKRVPDLSAQCAYYFLLSLFPFMIFAITVLGYLPITTEDILWIIGDVAPETTSELVRSNINTVLGVKHTGLMSFSIIFTVWSATLGIESLVQALNYAYGITAQRGFFKSKVIALLLMFGIILGILSAFVFNVFGARISDFLQYYLLLPKEVVVIWNSLRLYTNLLVLTLVFMGLYLIAPNKQVKLRYVIPGSLFASLGWHYTSLGFSFYVNNFANYSATYGGLGAIVVLMVWFYLSAMVLILGGQINAVVEHIGTKS